MKLKDLAGFLEEMTGIISHLLDRLRSGKVTVQMVKDWLEEPFPAFVGQLGYVDGFWINSPSSGSYSTISASSNGGCTIEGSSPVIEGGTSFDLPDGFKHRKVLHVKIFVARRDLKFDEPLFDELGQIGFLPGFFGLHIVWQHCRESKENLPSDHGATVIALQNTDCVFDQGIDKAVGAIVEGSGKWTFATRKYSDGIRAGEYLLIVTDDSGDCSS